MDKLTAIKIKYNDGTYSDQIPVSVLAGNVEWDSTHTLVDILGSIDVDVTGTIQDQISQLFNEKVSSTQLNNYVATQLNTDVTNWLQTNVNPVGSAVIVDSSLTVSGAAADAKKTGQLKHAFNDTIGATILYKGEITYSSGPKNWNTGIKLTGSKKLGIKFNNSTNKWLGVSAKVGSHWTTLKSIEDSAWHIVDIPSNVSEQLLISYRGSESLTVSCIIYELSEGDILSCKEDIANYKEDIANFDRQQIVEDVVYPYSGYISPSGNVVSSSEFFYSDFIPTQNLKLEVDIYWHQSVAAFTFYDANKTYINKYIKGQEIYSDKMKKQHIKIPEDATYVRVCTKPTYPNKVYIYKTKDILTDLQYKINGNELSYGNTEHKQVPYAFDLNFSACPCKRAEKSGKIKSIYVQSYGAGTTKIFIGKVDQLYLFVPRASFNIDLKAGANVYDVTDKNMYINEGEQILIKFIGGKTGFKSFSGQPEDDNSFYYSNLGDMQLQVYGAQRTAVFGFAYTVDSSIINEQGAQIDCNSDNINVLTKNVSALQAGINIITDRNGNKYKMIVQNGAIALLAMNFHHVLCVGNSYTTHPTVDDTETDYRNNLWWGHWSMAASSAETAWTHLLQTALRQKVSDAKVTPVLGRRYETTYSTYTLNNPNTFTYWDGTAWKALANDLANFTDVDAIVFFLGANYSGNDWYTLYSAMVEKFLTWFPNTTIFCCSCAGDVMQAKDTAIQTVANEHNAAYISMVGINGRSKRSKLGEYVNGDDDILHQINNSAVASHFGDYGEYLILDRICNAMGYENNTSLYDISITSVSDVELSVISTKTISGAIISVFANVETGTTLSGITVTDASGNNITVTDHGETSYGRVFTFVMPSANVTVTGNVS